MGKSLKHLSIYLKQIFLKLTPKYMICQFYFFFNGIVNGCVQHKYKYLPKEKCVVARGFLRTHKSVYGLIIGKCYIEV